jgi:hypothetical protein
LRLALSDPPSGRWSSKLRMPTKPAAIAGRMVSEVV